MGSVDGGGGSDGSEQVRSAVGARTKIWLEAVATDQYGRTVGVISNKRGDRLKSYNYEMVRGGHAHCYMLAAADADAYAAAETYAKDTRKGLWRARAVQVPKDFRVQQKHTQERSTKLALVLFTAAGAALAIALYLFSSGQVSG